MVKWYSSIRSETLKFPEEAWKKCYDSVLSMNVTNKAHLSHVYPTLISLVTKLTLSRHCFSRNCEGSAAMPLDVSMLRLLSQEQLTTLLRHIPGDKDMVIKQDSEIKFFRSFHKICS